MNQFTTRFYRHYKNMPYKYLGIARHSETLEELALYETLYENKTGRIWVRPKEMFFEQIEKDGKLQPRFKQVEFGLQSLHQLSEVDFKQMSEVYQEGFEEELSRQKIEERLTDVKSLLILSVYEENKMVGFKIGYALNAETYYSWIGAIRRDYRGLGLASELMKTQHKWSYEQGFRQIETKSRNQFTDMLRLDLKFGFQITAVEQDSDGRNKIIMKKALTPFKENK